MEHLLVSPYPATVEDHLRRFLFSVGLATGMSFLIACGGGPASSAVNAFTPSASTSTNSPAPAAGTVSGGSGGTSTGSTSASDPAAGSGGSGGASTGSTSAPNSAAGSGGTSAAPSTSPLPTPPSGATVISNVQ